MENYIDHNCSITVHVRDNEWDGVEQWLWDNWDEVIAVSFISLTISFTLSNTTYPQYPPRLINPSASPETAS